MAGALVADRFQFFGRLVAERLHRGRRVAERLADPLGSVEVRGRGRIAVRRLALLAAYASTWGRISSRSAGNAAFCSRNAACASTPLSG
jgi:hypothetical protein